MKIKIQEPIKLLRRENMSELIQFPKLETSKNKLPNLMFREDVMKYFGLKLSLNTIPMGIRLESQIMTQMGH